MRRITISDERGTDGPLSFDLGDILQEIGPGVESSNWRASYVECFGKGADKLHALSDAGTLNSGSDLIRIASDVYQAIEGTFFGYDEEILPNPWIIVQAIDSSVFHVQSADEKVMDRLTRRFKEVVEIPTE